MSFLEKIGFKRVLTTSEKGLTLIKSFEGLRLKAYICPAGKWTIGYGHTEKVYRGMEITRKEAEKLLIKDIKKFEKAVRDLVKVPLKQHEFDALVSFTYNVGIGALSSSTLLKKLNRGDRSGAANEFSKWRLGGSPKRVISGLVIRRKAEQTLFLGK